LLQAAAWAIEFSQRFLKERRQPSLKGLSASQLQPKGRDEIVDDAS
jgi:hypothetical protein